MIQIWSRTVESLSFAIPWRYFKDAASNPCQELTAYPSVIRDQIRDTFIENLRSLESVPGPHSSTRLRPAATTSCGKLSHASASDDPQATRAKTFQSSFFAAPSHFSSLFFLSPLSLPPWNHPLTTFSREIVASERVLSNSRINSLPFAALRFICSVSWLRAVTKFGKMAR